MTVKCLTKIQKECIVENHKRRNFNQKTQAKFYKVSERTINRVLNEAGVATAVPRIQGEAYRAMQILKKHNIHVDQLDRILSTRYQTAA